ncbi:MAG: NAD(P)/FAD-dependent oxidoreductase [Prevotellaceae bacterium]|jgi:all-trans-retinol 13,14-reductase|nr:NAD(P)/FAD-dependent oxidoreductase [Prevotellaceae bacterium]
MDKKQTVIIIGGGIGGLFCAAILSKEGYDVQVFEQHYKIGGGLHTFKREGVEFETGMHVVGTFHEGGVMNKICSWLGIMDKLSILPSDDDCFELFQIGSDGKTYRYAKGAERFIDTLAQDFPEERENITRYVQAMYDIVSKSKMYNLEYGDFSIQFLEEFMLSVGNFIDSFTQNEKLRAVLALSNPLYGGDRYQTPAYIHCVISVLYIESAGRFVGGSQQLADVLVELIQNNGGKVFTRNGVKNIEIKDKNIEYIETADGKRHTADWYISTIHPSSLFKLMDMSKIQRSYWQRIDSIPNSYSSFTVYIIFKPESFPYMNHTGYYIDDYSQVWSHGEYNADTFPNGMMYLTPPTTMTDKWAQKMIINCIMSFDAVQQWEDTTVGKRGEEYNAFKKRCEQQILDKMEKLFPNIKDCIKSVYSASPLTIRDFYSQKEGALYGVKKDCENIMLSHIPVRTKLKNLLLSGQNINLHGIVGTPLTALNTCGELIGLELLLNKINNYELAN